MKLIYLTLILSFFVSISLAQPANDDPCEATSLTVGGTCSLTSSTSAGATNTTGFGAPSCSIYSNKDVWFSFVAPGSGNITIKSTI
ncbi:MAG: hypothetical protein H7Y00_04495, partial [Fimbriimonadaceae bacterium]|nr:hypothetical protein [Chitinophagales bacterium]